MSLVQLRDELVKGKLSPYYVFVGDDFAVIEIYIRQIERLFGSAYTRVDSLSAVYSKLQNRSITKTKACYIIRDDKDYMKQEQLWESLRSGAAQGDNILIFVYTAALDKRSKFYKAHADVFVEFENMSAPILGKHLAKQYGINSKNAETLATLCSCNYGRALMEADKLYCLSKQLKSTIDVAFEFAVKSNAIYTPPQDVIFQLVDAVCRKERKQCFVLWQELEAIQESPLAVLSLVYSNIRGMLVVQAAGNGANICERTGLTVWQVKLAKEKIGLYSLNELEEALGVIRDIEKGIKTGAVDTAIAVEFMLVQLLRW